MLAAALARSRPSFRVSVAAHAVASASGALSLSALATTRLRGQRLSADPPSSAAMSTAASVKPELKQYPASSVLAKTAQKKAMRIGARGFDNRMMMSDRLGSRLDVLRTHLHRHHHLFDLLNALSPFTTSFAPAPMEMNLYVSSTTIAYTVHASMPGMNKSDFNITVDDGILRIEAERNEQRFEDIPRLSTNSAAASLPLPQPQGTTAPTTATSSTKKGALQDKDTGPGKAEAKQTQQEGTVARDIEYDTGESAHDDDVTVHYGESFFGRIERSLELPEDANFTAMTAKYRDGVLEIVVPRQQRESMGGTKIVVQ